MNTHNSEEKAQIETLAHAWQEAWAISHLHLCHNRKLKQPCKPIAKCRNAIQTSEAVQGAEIRPKPAWSGNSAPV